MTERGGSNTASPRNQTSSLRVESKTAGPVGVRRGHSVPHPIPYQGSKRSLAPAILRYFPNEMTRFVEPFAGSAALSLAAAHAGVAQSFILNDAHEPLAALWRAIVDEPATLADQYEELWTRQIGNERQFFDVVRSEFNHAPRPGHFLYLLARCAKAAVRYNAAGEFNNSPDNRRKGARPAQMRARIEGAARLLGGRTTISGRHYRDVLAECGGADLIYMDPPYQGVSGRRDTRYALKFDHAEFCDALAALNRRDILYAVSYDGRTGDRVFGAPLPDSLDLQRLEIPAGRSASATLLGRTSETYESLYLSRALRLRLQATGHRLQK